MNEIRKCALCGKNNGKIIAVKECTKRTRLLTCEECWKMYYENETMNEKISLLERSLIILNREKTLAGSTRKLINMFAVLLTLLVVVFLARILSSVMFDNDMLQQILIIKNISVAKLLDVFLLFCGVCIGIYVFCIIFRIVIRYVLKSDE